MFRVKYSDLNLSQVQALVDPAKAPEHASPLCPCLVGKKLELVLDEKPVPGPVLRYEFLSEDRLLLSENGGEPAECGYGALSHRHMTLFSHMIPGTLRGYTVILNRETNVVTVFEMWFIDHEGTDYRESGMDVFAPSALDGFINREGQRQVYTGYAKAEGAEPPTIRDSVTLRLDNRMILWDDDLGRRQLFTYATSLFFTMVEPYSPDWYDVLTFPSDTYKISDDLFVFSCGEVEYSGRLSVEVVDILLNEKIGMILGIDEKDRYEYSLYRGKGRMLGQLATFHDFNDKGLVRSPTHTERMDYSRRGARATYRTSVLAHPFNEDMMREFAKAPHIFPSMQQGEQQMMSSKELMGESDLCVGKEISLRFDDGAAWDYQFPSIHELEFRKPGEAEWHREMCKPFRLDDGLVAVGHYCSAEYPPTSHILFLDFHNGCATCIEAVLGSKNDLRDVEPRYHFGYMITEGVEPPRLMRHGFTRELLGRSFTWTYSDMMSSQHIYNSPHSYSWTIINNTKPGDPMNRAGGYVWSSPCEYIKLRKDVYVMNWVEQKWEGIMGCAAMNLRLMHDCGFTFGVGMGGDCVMIEVMGALARPAGSVDLSGVYEL